MGARHAATRGEGRSDALIICEPESECRRFGSEADDVSGGVAVRWLAWVRIQFESPVSREVERGLL